MNQLIALDIALLLPPELDTLCRRINSTTGASPFSDFRKTDNHPHITLAMGVFPVAYIEALYAALLPFQITHHPLPLTVKDLYKKHSEQIGQEYQLQIERIEDICSLQRDVMSRLRNYFAAETATREMVRVDSDEQWEPNTTYWIDGFKHKKPEDYTPHISLKCREAKLPSEIDLNFVVDRLAIARVGNYCSCRDILREVILT